MGRRRPEGHGARITVALLCLLAGTSAPLLSCAGIFTAFRSSPQAPQSALDVAKQFERNYDYAHAYAAYSKILREPGSDHGHAEAEIGAAKALDELKRKPGAAECLFQLNRRDEAVAGLEAAEKRLRGFHDRSRILLRLARFYDDERALDVYRRIVAAYPGTPEAADALFFQGPALKRLGRM